MLKKAKWIFVLPFVLIVFVYLSLSTFLWMSEKPILASSNSSTESVYFRSQKLHSITVIDDGLASLSERIRLIEGATKSLAQQSDHYQKAY